MFQSKKILITGGIGFIGSNLALSCFKKGANVTILDNCDFHSGANLYNIKPIQKEVIFLNHDIRNEKVLAKILTNTDIIFHCAAHTSHPGSMEDPFMDLDINARGTLVLLESVRKYNPKIQVIYTATSTQVGKMKINPITELHCEFPCDIYSAHKSLGEKYMEIYSRVYGINTTSIRLPNVYGPRAVISSSEFGFINYFIGLALSGKPIPLYGSGNQHRSVLYIEDVVDALLRTIGKRGKGEVYFVSSSDFPTVYTIAKSIERIVGGKIKKMQWPKDRKKIEVGNVYIDDRKFRNKFNWNPEVSLREGLKATKEYYHSCLSHYIKDSAINL